MRESPFLKSLAYQFLGVLGFAVVMAEIGAFGTYERLPLPSRFVYFAVIALLTWIQVTLLAAWFGTIEFIGRWPVVVRMALVGALAAIPGTLEVVVVHSWLSSRIPWSVAWSVYPDNAFLTIVISILAGLYVEQRRHAEADAERARVADLPQAAPTDFFRRIPPALGRDLLALQMEDHYLRIHTAVGSDLILMRLRDAIAELGGEHGRQVHRSWWVANGAVQSSERAGARTTLTLRNGLIVPVSKTFRDGLKEAGWL